MRLKLILLPYDNRDPNNGENMPAMSFPPLGISTLTSFLRSEGYSVDQDDLDIKMETYNERSKQARKIDMSLFSDEGRIRSFFVEGHEPVLEDAGERILKMTSLKGYDIIGLSVVKPDTPSTVGVPLVLGKLIKERQDAHILIGGATNVATEAKVLASGHVDYGIIGDPNTSIGEINTLRFCQEFEKGSNLKSVPGVKYWTGKTVKWNKREYSRQEKCLITKPTFDGLPIDLYRRKRRILVGDEVHIFKGLVLSYYFMRGCPHRCAFCCHSHEGSLWAARNPEDIALDLKELSRRYRTPYFFFHNATINPTYSFAESLADELINQDVNIRWTDCANMNPMDAKLLSKLRQAGAIQLVFGFESASPPILRLINKPFTVEKAAATIRAAYEAGIWTDLDLICGFPYEGAADTEATIRFLEEHQRYIMSCNLNKFWLEGTFHQHPEQFGIKMTFGEDALYRDWSQQYEETYGLNMRERAKMTEKTYQQVFEVINRLFFTPPGIPQIFTYMEIESDLSSWKRIYKGRLSRP